MFKKITSFLVRIILLFPNSPIKDAVRDIFYGDIISERIVEYPFVFALLGLDKKREEKKILDVGCYYSNFPIQLASMGFKTWGIDVTPYQLRHPNFTFVRGDIQGTKFSNNFFDIVTAISTIEHIGMGYYGDKEGKSSEKDAIKEISRITKKGGKFILTVPYSKVFRVGKTQRFYDKKSLELLLKPYFKIRNMFIFQSKNGKWFPVNEKSVATSKGEKTKAFSVIYAQKTYE
jgi:SAM-dependent methyltransferase